MAYGHDGFISIYETSEWLGGDLVDPQALAVEGESLGLTPDIKFRGEQIGHSRAYVGSNFVAGPVKPAGKVKIPLRAGDSIKFLYSHFQYGSYLGTIASGENEWIFYPSQGNPNYSFGTFGNGPYGGTGYVYPVSFVKKYNNKTTGNTQLYKWGVCDSLEFSVFNDKQATLEGDFKFATYYSGTALPITYIPGDSRAGTYSSEKPMEFWAGTLLVGGESIEVSSLKITSKNNITEKTVLGEMNPSYFEFGRYECDGELTLAMPDDGLKYVGSMLAMKVFSVTGTLFVGTHAVMTLSMPTCRYRSFDVSGNQGNNEWSMSIPFSAYGTVGTAPLTVGLITDYDVSGIIYDALYGARTLSEFELLDAEYAARTLGDFTYLDRDI